MCVNRARTGLWGPGAGNCPGRPGRCARNFFAFCTRVSVVRVVLPQPRFTYAVHVRDNLDVMNGGRLHGHSVTWKTMMVDAQAPSAGRLFGPGSRIHRNSS